MKNHVMGFAFIFLILVPQLSMAGGQVGSGGDTVRCTATPENRFRGLYSLDYLLTLGAGGLEQGTVAVGTWEISKNRILTNLRAKFPELATSFESFIKDMNNMRDWTRPRIWLPAPHGLIIIDDQQIIRSLPKNCYQVVDDKINLIQTVIRTKKPDIIEYEMDIDVLVELMNDPLQFSYLMVHEWLWDHTDDVQSIRWANQLLHSDELDNLSAADLQKSLRNIGLDQPKPLP